MEEKITSNETETIKTPEEKVDTQKEEKVVTVEEMQRRIAKEKEKYEELEKSIPTIIQEKLDEKEKISKMKAEELAEYKAKEAERKYKEEVEKYQAKIAEFEREKHISQIREEAGNKLNELKIPVSKEILDLVQEESIEQTIGKINTLSSLLEEERNKYIGNGVPSASGGLGKPKSKTDGDLFASARLVK